MKQEQETKRLLERYWVSLIDSHRFRSFARQGVGKRLFGSRVYRQTVRAKRYATSYYQALTNQGLFEDVRTLCFFIGHTKSGGTMIGALLDAHPNIVMADEIDILKHVESGYSRDQLFHVLLKGSRREAMKGRVTARRLQAYSFEVPGQWQGRYEAIKVIGASKAGPTTRRLGPDVALLEQTQSAMDGLDMKLIQVIRNPFDPISVMRVRGKRSFEDAVEHYFDYCETLVKLRARLGENQLLPVYYERFVAEPQQRLAQICDFLEMEADAGYLEACAAVIWPEADRSRDLIDWPAGWIKIVEERSESYDFLRGYRFDN